jgi:ribosome-associated translation inhibitor RaiA
VDTADFEFEFYAEVPDPEYALRAEAENRLRELAAGHSDMIGASVALEQPAHGETPYVYQARVVAYIRPDNVVAVEKGETAETALKGALGALDRQVRDLRDRLGKPWQQP